MCMGLVVIDVHSCLATVDLDPESKSTGGVQAIISKCAGIICSGKRRYKIRTCLQPRGRPQPSRGLMAVMLSCTVCM